MFGFFGKKESKDSLADEVLREGVRTLFRRVAQRNGDSDLTEWPDDKQLIYLCNYIMLWFVRWAVYEIRQTQQAKLSSQEMGASFVILDRLYLNISNRYGFTKDEFAKMWDPTFAKFIRQIVFEGKAEKTNKEILESQRNKLELAIGFLKNCERLTPSFLLELDAQIQNVFIEVTDVFVLAEKENATGAFQPLMEKWKTLSENFNELTKHN
jgi:hypothetical protein